MQLGQLSSWPPFDSAGPDGLAAGEGVYRRCDYVPETPRGAAHLEILVEHGNRLHRVIYWHTSEIILRRVEATLKDQSGIPMAMTRDLELAGFPTS